MPEKENKADKLATEGGLLERLKIRRKKIESGQLQGDLTIKKNKKKKAEKKKSEKKKEKKPSNKDILDFLESGELN